MLSDILKEQTATEHQQLEVSLVRRLKGMEDISAYVQLLDVFYGYYAGVEPLLDKYLNDEVLPHYSRRRKAGLLLQDAQHFNSHHHPELCDELPPVNNLYQAMGVMYVLEGSTLGGQIITKMIVKSLNLATTDGTMFFSGYGDNTQPMWASFRQALNHYDDEAEQVVNAARATFVTFKNWIELKLSTEQQHIPDKETA